MSTKSSLIYKEFGISSLHIFHEAGTEEYFMEDEQRNCIILPNSEFAEILTNALENIKLKAVKELPVTICPLKKDLLEEFTYENHVFKVPEEKEGTWEVVDFKGVKE
jgi:hypothetical protein